MKGTMLLVLVGMLYASNTDAVPKSAPAAASPACECHHEDGTVIPAATASDKHLPMMIALAAAIVGSISILGGAFAQGKIASTALEGISRNPGAAGKIFIPLLLSLAFVESLVLYGFLIAIFVMTWL